jgi:NTP pyrophosphatase (non-canonical NTP hydrolase)
MKINDYITKSSSTAIYPHQRTIAGLDYVMTGMGGEAGEVMEIIKKVIRDSDGIIPDVGRLSGEIFDLLWYWSQVMVETQGKFEDEFDVDRLQTGVEKSIKFGNSISGS